jgi:NAD(P)-dependent dehydrogenase (short-subunit alcohol dehydrogenase family)
MTDTHPALQEGNAALITGGASGIGLAVAQRLSALGLRLVLLDKTAEALAEAARQLPGEVATYAVDVADAGAMERVAAEVKQRFGPLSLVMANAGTGRAGDIWSDPDGWERVIGTNLGGVINAVRFFARPMVEGDKPGLVICTGSKQGITQPPGDTAYNISKSGVKALAEGLAHQLREETAGRVSAHLLVPGFTYTGMMTGWFKEKPDAAWTAQQVADFMLERIAAGDFYIICPDNETTPEIDAKRFLWHAQDMVQNRPALSRWHPDWKDAFARYMAGE